MNGLHLQSQLVLWHEPHEATGEPGRVINNVVTISPHYLKSSVLSPDEIKADAEQRSAHVCVEIAMHDRAERQKALEVQIGEALRMHSTDPFDLREKAYALGKLQGEYHGLTRAVRHVWRELGVGEHGGHITGPLPTEATRVGR